MPILLGVFWQGGGHNVFILRGGKDWREPRRATLKAVGGRKGKRIVILKCEGACDGLALCLKREEDFSSFPL